VAVFVPEGEKLAVKTLNARLGIVGGISILGTTGLVRPMSHEAYQATITAALSVARAAGLDHVVLTTGRRSERFAQALWPHLAPMAFVQMGDYFKMALEAAARMGFAEVIIAVFFGKALKMAAGLAHTHAASAALSTAPLAQLVGHATADAALAAEVAGANTARQALDLVATRCPQVLETVAAQVAAAAGFFTGKNTVIRVVIFDYEGKPLGKIWANPL
jgi:cobalt-precorrin-5B (C1)-methyltransferase